VLHVHTEKADSLNENANARKEINHEKRFGMGNKKVIKARDIDGDGKKSSYEMARAKGMAKGMGARFEAKKGGSAYHTTKDGRRVKKGLYYYMNKRKKAGTSRKGTGTVSAKALKRSAKTAKK
jgi:hypothetical protein